MEIFQCRYITHENEEIIGFCLNENCSKATQYCYQCLNKIHSDHQNDCIRFFTLSEQLKQFIQIQNHQSQQIKEIVTQLKNCLEQIQKKIDQDITILENMDGQLLNKNYLTFKSQIHIIKKYYSQEKQKEIQQQIIELNKYLNAIKNMSLFETQAIDQVNSANQKNIKIVEIKETQIQLENQQAKILLNQGIELLKNGQFQEALNKFEDSITLYAKDEEVFSLKGSALKSLCQFQEAIESYDRAISINPNCQNAWNNKGLTLKSLNQFQEAIKCCDKAISINPNCYNAWNNKGLALNSLSQFQEAIECCENAISINPKDHIALVIKGFALHNQKQYQNAIVYYDKALSICTHPQILRLKADLLFQLGKKSEAKISYKAALQQGSTEKDYIVQQLSKI